MSTPDFPVVAPGMWPLSQQRNPWMMPAKPADMLTKRRLEAAETIKKVGFSVMIELLEDMVPEGHWLERALADGPPAPPVPDLASTVRRLVPARWRSRDRNDSVTAPVFLQMHYKRWLEEKDLGFTRAVLRQVDPQLWAALAKVQTTKVTLVEPFIGGRPKRKSAGS